MLLTSTGGYHFLKEQDSASLDILILDLRMTNGDGLEVMAELAKKKPETKSLFFPVSTVVHSWGRC